jgi:Flp pilus assembly protein TadG
MKQILKFKRNTEGQSLVEFALVLPFLLALILGMVEFGWILNGKITLTSAAREGARTAIIYETEDDAKDAVESAVSKSAESSSLIIDSVTTDFNDTTRRAVINVTAHIKPIVGLYFHGNVTVTAKAEMRIE